MSIKSYVGKGKPHYTIINRQDKLNAKLEELAQKDANFQENFKPATNRAEFDVLYNKYMIENAEYEDIKDEKPKKDTTNNSSSTNEQTASSKNSTSNNNKDATSGKGTANDFMTKDESFFQDESLPTDTAHGLDEMATKNVNTRDYVMKKGFESDTDTANSNKNGQENRTFDREPESWDDAFKIPEPDDQQIYIDDNDNMDSNNGGSGGFTKNSSSSGGNSSSNGGGSQSSSSKPKQPPLNSSFNEMSGSKQRKNSKRMATMAIDVLSKFSEITFVYFCNKDITHERLIEMQDEGLIDLNFPIELEAGQQQAIRFFFMEQRLKAEELSKLDKEDREDLIEALTDVIMEKGVALTPIQQLGVTFASVFIKKGIEAFAFSKINKGILEYAMNNQAGVREEQPETANVVTQQKEEVVQDITPTQSQPTNNSNDFLSTESDLETELQESRNALSKTTETKTEENPFVQGVSMLG